MLVLLAASLDRHVRRHDPRIIIVLRPPSFTLERTLAGNWRSQPSAGAHDCQRELTHSHSR